MRPLNARTVLICFAALLFVVACADTSKKPADAPTQAVETPTQDAVASVEEVTLTVTGMT